MEIPFCWLLLNTFAGMIDCDGIENIIMAMFINFFASGIANVVEDRCSLYHQGASATGLCSALLGRCVFVCLYVCMFVYLFVVDAVTRR